VLAAVACAAVFAAFGCTSTVTPPPAPEDPQAVYLLQDDRHVGLLLPRAPGRVVEYGFGDWDWYAMERDAWYNVFDTVLWPTQGTLCRRELAAHGAADLRARLPWATVHEFAVERARAGALLLDLDAQFAAHADELHHSARYGMDFVPHDDGYWLFHNCNDVLADWLRRLGCEVSWVPVRLGLAVTAP
jgi:hypothetical protein